MMPRSTILFDGYGKAGPNEEYRGPSSGRGKAHRIHRAKGLRIIGAAEIFLARMAAFCSPDTHLNAPGSQKATFFANNVLPRPVTRKISF